MNKSYSADLNNLETLAVDVETFCEENGIGSADCFAINLCLDEIFTNIVTYGYKNDPSKDIEIEMLTDGHCVSITMRDKAAKFDPLTDAANPDTSASLEKRDIGGLGIFFLRKNMDDISYSYKDKTNILKMLKKIGTSPIPSDGE